MRERWRQRLRPGARQEASQIVASGEPLGFCQLSGDVKEVCVPVGRGVESRGNGEDNGKRVAGSESAGAGRSVRREVRGPPPATG